MEQVRVGRIQLTRRGEDNAGFQAAIKYWKNNSSGWDELVFTIPVKDFVDESIRKDEKKVAGYFAQYATAELLDVNCFRCGDTLEPMPVRSRRHARKLLSTQRIPWGGNPILCGFCEHARDRWIEDMSHLALPTLLTAGQLIAVLALAEGGRLKPVMRGNDIMDALNDDDLLYDLFLKVFAPVEAIRTHAYTYEGGCIPGLLTWMAAGKGTPEERADALLEKAYDQSYLPIEEYNRYELVALTLKCIQDEAIAYFRFLLKDRLPEKDLSAFDKKIRNVVASNWDELSLNGFYAAMQKAIASAPEIEENDEDAFRWIWKVIGEFERLACAFETHRQKHDEMRQPAELPHQPLTQALFETVLEEFELLEMTHRDFMYMPHRSNPGSGSSSFDDDHDEFFEIASDAFRQFVHEVVSRSADRADAEPYLQFLELFDSYREEGPQGDTPFHHARRAVELLLQGYEPEESINELLHVTGALWKASCAVARGEDPNKHLFD